MSYAVLRATSGRYVVETSTLREDRDSVFYDRLEAEREADRLNAARRAEATRAGEGFALFDEEEHL